MKRPILFIVFKLICLESFSQKLPPFKALRYEEDYTFLQENTNRSWYEKMKYTPLSKQGKAYVSHGGEVRYRYFKYRNEDWGEAPKDRDGFVLNRYLGHLDLRTSKYFRVFFQLQSSLVNGRIAATSPVEENQLDLHQAFIDIRLKLSQQDHLSLRVGRQEFLYGSQRLISVRELPNNRQAFDGIKTMLAGNRYNLDIFYSHYITAKKGIFDDGFNRDIRLWGVYGIRKELSLLKNLDVYYLGLWKKQALFDDDTGEEWRHSVGGRIWGAPANWEYDLEGLYQFGTFADKEISAWTLSINGSYQWKEIRFRPELGLKTELISGDAAREDNQLQTFNPLFPRGSYFGLAAFIGPANLADVHPSLMLEIIPEKLTWTLDYDAFWRYSRNDGIYSPSVSLIYSGKETTSRFIGQQAALDFTYTPNMYLLLRAEGTWFKAGEFLKQAGSGKDILFVGLTAQFKY